MAGTHITDQQVRLYMSERKEDRTQAVAAAKAGVSVRSARRIDTGEIATGPVPQRHWRTRQDPLAGVWDSELVPLLEANPELLPTRIAPSPSEQAGQYGATVGIAILSVVAGAHRTGDALPHIRRFSCCRTECPWNRQLPWPVGDLEENRRFFALMLFG